MTRLIIRPGDVDLGIFNIQQTDVKVALMGEGLTDNPWTVHMRQGLDKFLAYHVGNVRSLDADYSFVISLRAYPWDTLSLCFTITGRRQANKGAARSQIVFLNRA